MSLITAIIPSYNGVSRYLAQAIESVRAQTYREIELIVVDDASSDETGQLVQRYPQARYIRRSVNGGQAAARNEGARHAKGEFLAFLDQDDLWKPTFLEEMLRVLESRPKAAVVHCDGHQVNEQGDVLEHDAAMKHTGSITQLLRGGHDVATSGSLFRRACFDAVGGYDEQLPIWEDIDVAIRLFERYEIIHYAHALYCHRLYGHNVSRGIASERALFGRRRFLEKHQHSCQPGSPLEQALRKDWSQYYGDLGKHYLRKGNRTEARTAFRQALRCHMSAKMFLRLLRSYMP
jgi:glycosyltransferase involved in cell wall biosynthesis